MLSGVTCECVNENGGDNSCTKVINDDCFFTHNQLALECKDEKCLCADRFYQRFTNVCRRESIPNESLSNYFIDYSLELNSIGAESNCTSIGTQTHSRDANIQTESLESLDTPSELNEKLGSFSNTSKRVRNYINYNRLDNSDYTKAESSLESSVKDESTQFGESGGESENNKSWSNRYNYNHKKISSCHCQDPFYPRDYKSELNNVVEDEIYFGNENTNFNPKAHHHCIYKNDHICFPADIRRNYMKRQHSFRVNSLYSPPNQNQYALHTFCPCYNYTKYNNFSTEHYKEAITEKFNENYKVNNNESSQRNTCECKLNFNAQEHDTEATIMQHENDSMRKDNCVNNNNAAGYKVEMLNEKVKHNQFTDSFIVEKECLEKECDDSNFTEENEQSKPLLGDNDERKDNGNKINSSNHNIAVKVEEGEKDDDLEGNAGLGCHCHHHHHYSAPESNNQNCIRIRPSKKKSSSKKTSPLKVITLLLFASAFLITGSAIRDAYYP
ncbi:hypothetical protein PVAND_008307 [Polypedilum vanderplanki]|uniref:Uncharacterized protein n=1 Tax=Polypedilum vanderplanki TaxID=319348 RepID=A0A9J6CA63_POLVA|nr:hypothetical protein PVAND_008307 [Polypedilum vanderplanki]